MPFNVLLLPLLGGYIFLTNLNLTRFGTKRHSGERLIFHAAAAGIWLLLVSFIVVRIIATQVPEARLWWSQNIPFAYAGTSFGAFLLGTFSWYPLNRLFFPHEPEARKAIERSNDYLENLLLRAIEGTIFVSLTLKSGKVYIGLILKNFDPAFERRHVALLPFRSGFRNNKLTVSFTTDYARVYQQIVDNQEPVSASQDDFQVIIPVSEIQSANLFDPVAYRLFNPDQQL